MPQPLFPMALFNCETKRGQPTLGVMAKNEDTQFGAISAILSAFIKIDCLQAAIIVSVGMVNLAQEVYTPLVGLGTVDS